MLAGSVGNYWSTEHPTLFSHTKIGEKINPTKRKCVLRSWADSEDPEDAQSDQGLHCTLTESLDTTKYMNGEQGAAGTLSKCMVIIIFALCTCLKALFA